MPAPRKYPNELRDRAQRLVAEAMSEDPSLSMNASIKALQAEVRELKRANEMPLAASSFFARELDPQRPW